MPIPQPNNYSDWYEGVYPALSGQGLWLRGNEMNTLPMQEFERRPFKALFTRLSGYADVSESFTHQLLYQIAAGIDEVFPDLAYLPPEHDRRFFAARAVPWLLGTTSKRGALAFDLVGFSNAIIQEVINIPWFLKTSGIPLSACERQGRQDIPLVILGGANAAHSSVLLGTEGWVDGIFVGCDARAIRGLLVRCAAAKEQGIKKEALLAQLQDEIPGFYATASVRKEGKAQCSSPDASVLLTSGFVPYTQEDISTGYLQISHGCRSQCSFCAESWQRKPYVEFDVATLLKKALAMKRERGAERIDLFSFNFTMHKGFYALLWECATLFDHVSLKSQRFDMIALDPAMVDYQVAAGKTIFSCALEGISTRLRKFLNKNLDEEAVLNSLALLIKAGAREIKIFLLSTGLETEEDFEEFKMLRSSLEGMCRTARHKPRIVFSVTPLVRFPGTPLEFDNAPLPQVHAMIMEKICVEARFVGFEARQAMDEQEYVLSQVLARADDPRICAALIAAAQRTGFVYQRGLSPRFYQSFVEILAREGLTLAHLLQGFSFEESQSKPWAVFESRAKREVLWKAYRKNRKFSEIGVSFAEPIAEKPKYRVDELRTHLRQRAQDQVAYPLSVQWSERSRGVPRKYAGLALACALMKAFPQVTPFFCRFSASYWGQDPQQNCWITGDDVVTLIWQQEGIKKLAKVLNSQKGIDAVNACFDGWGRLTGVALTPADPRYIVHIDAAYEFVPREYSKKKGLIFEVRKQLDGSYLCIFPAESLKKRIITGMSYVRHPGARYEVRIEIGPKFEYEDFVRTAFTYAHEKEWVRVSARAERAQ